MNLKDYSYRKVYNTLFLCLIIAVTLFKIGDFSLPYFWDELGVYSQTAVYQYHHGISLMPASLPPDISRGHPLFFTVLNAFVFRFFGPSILAGHLFNFGISVLLLLFLYKKLGGYYGYLTAIVAVVLVCLQPLFLAQANLIIPEMLLALLMITAIISFYEGNYWLYALCAGLAILTKESAIVLPPVVLFYSAIRYVGLRDNERVFRPFHLLAIFLPFIVYGVFLIIQKKQNGWYFFPYHIEGLSFSMDRFLQQSKSFLEFIFWQQGRCWFLVPIVLSLIKGAITADFNLRRIISNPLFPLVIFALAFFVFSALNFYMERYVLSIVICYCAITAITLVFLSRNKIFLSGALFFVALVTYPTLDTPKFNYDYDLGYRHQVRVTAQAVDYLTAIATQREPVFANWPANVAIAFPEGGYLKGHNINWQDGLRPHVLYMIYCEPGGQLPDHTWENYNFDELKSFKEKEYVARVYSVHSKK